ncbi:MAG: hypothetical protein ACRDHY_19305 [Anaerolineales bacterium]
MPEELYVRDASGALKPLDASNPLLSRRDAVDAAILAEASLTWANSDPANTEKLQTITLPAAGPRVSRVFVRNPSTVTALTVQAQEQRGSRWFTLAEWTVAAATANTDEQGQTAKQAVQSVEGWPLGPTAARLRLRNNTALGVSDGFTATVEVRRKE